MTLPDGRHGPGPDDADLGRLLAEGLHRQTDGPVDERGLLTGARRGAVRIRRRRSAAVGLAVVVVLAGVPVGLLRSHLAGQASETSAGSAASAPTFASPGPLDAGKSAPAVAGPESARGFGAESGAGATAPAAPSETGALTTHGLLVPSASAMSSSAASAASIPDAALLTAADISQVAMSPMADRVPAPATVAADSCGRPLTAVPAAITSRAVGYQNKPGPAATAWQLGSAVRVFGGDGASGYLAAAQRLGCTGLTLTGIGDAATGGHGPADALGRTHWYVVVRVGHAVSEVNLVVPRGSGVTSADVARLAGLAADRLAASGLGG
jgi:hypothetical protein